MLQVTEIMKSKILEVTEDVENRILEVHENQILGLTEDYKNANQSILKAQGIPIVSKNNASNKNKNQAQLKPSDIDVLGTLRKRGRPKGRANSVTVDCSAPKRKKNYKNASDSKDQTD